MRQLRFALALAALLVARAADAQPYVLSSPVSHLATLFTDLYGPGGLKVDSLATLPGEQPHTAHFNSDFQSNFSQFGTALVNQFVSLPLPSPTSGFIYEFDPSLGVFHRTTRSFGPVLAERADTLGARRVSLGFAFQRFTFDSVEGLDLHGVPAVFTHDNAQLLGGREDVVTTTNAIDVIVNQTTAYLTLGVTEQLDLSIAVPFISNSLRVVSTATIQRIGTTNPLDGCGRDHLEAVVDERHRHRHIEVLGHTHGHVGRALVDRRTNRIPRGDDVLAAAEELGVVVREHRGHIGQIEPFDRIERDPLKREPEGDAPGP